MCETKNEFRDNLVEKLKKQTGKYNDWYRVFHLGIVSKERYKTIKDAKILAGCICDCGSIPIQSDTCQILANGKDVVLIFTKQQMMNTIHQKDVKTLITKAEKVKSTLNQIEKVLGDVPIITQLKTEVKDCLIAINKFLND